MLLMLMRSGTSTLSSVSTSLKSRRCAQHSLTSFAALPSFMTRAIKYQVPYSICKTALLQVKKAMQPNQSTWLGKEVLAGFQSLPDPLPQAGPLHVMYKPYSKALTMILKVTDNGNYHRKHSTLFSRQKQSDVIIITSAERQDLSLH